MGYRRAAARDTLDLSGRRAYHYQGKDVFELQAVSGTLHQQKWNQIEELERLLVEDLCYSIVPMEELAQVAGLTTPVITAMVDILKVITGYDYRANGLHLTELGLSGLSREDIMRFAEDDRS